MLADVIYKLGISLLLVEVKDSFIHAVLSRNAISESDEQIRELYDRVTNNKYSEDTYNTYEEQDIKNQVQKVDKISREPTVENLVTIIQLFSESLQQRKWIKPHG